MEKKVGNLVYFVLLFLYTACYGCDASIVLRIQDMNHKPIEQAMCQAPFILQVEINNLDNCRDRDIMQNIAGFENFQASRSSAKSQNISIINGKKVTQAVYEFVLRAEKKGRFRVKLGLRDKSLTMIESNVLMIQVDDEIISDTQNQKEEYIFKIIVDKKQAYVGQKVRLTAQFYDRILVDDLHLQFPELQDIRITKKKNNIQQKKVIFEGQEYKLTEWTFDMYITQPGTFLLQDIQAAFFEPATASRFNFSGAIDFFKAFHKTEKHVIANPVKIEVLPLPKDPKYPVVHGVGQFTKFELAMQQWELEVGQGTTLTMKLHGDANFEIMDPVPLQLPEHFNYYDSNSNSIDDQKGYKQSEYIMQANQQGEYQIKPQTLIYFDPVEHAYKTLQSNSLQITVLPSQRHALLVEQTELQEDILEQDGQNKLNDFVIYQNGQVHALAANKFSNSLFHTLVWILSLLMMLWYLWSRWLYDYVVYNRRLQRWYIFMQVGYAYKKAQAGKDSKMLYEMFMHLFCQLLATKRGTLHDADIIDYLLEKGFSHQQMADWKDFYSRLLQASFSSSARVDVSLLFKQAADWIQLLKGIA